MTDQPGTEPEQRLPALQAMARGEQVAIELANGQRPHGTIDWVSGGEAGIVKDGAEGAIGQERSSSWVGVLPPRSS